MRGANAAVDLAQLFLAIGVLGVFRTVALGGGFLMLAANGAGAFSVERPRASTVPLARTTKISLRSPSSWMPPAIATASPIV